MIIVDCFCWYQTWCRQERAWQKCQKRNRLLHPSSTSSASSRFYFICFIPLFLLLLLSFHLLTASLAQWLRRPPRERKVPGSNPACDGIFSGSSHTSDLNIGTPVATLPGAWRYRVSAGTGRPGVSILGLGEMESWICNFYLSVAARKIV